MDGDEAIGTPETPAYEGGTLRNHPSVILGNVIAWSIIIWVTLGSMLSGVMADGGLDSTTTPFLAAFAIIVEAAMAFLFYRWWKLTTYEFLENEIHVRRDTILKKEKHIQYARLASVNTQRGIINKIFGTTTLMFNVNSSVNSNRPEATLSIKADLADALRNDLNSKIFKRTETVEEDRMIESMVHVSNGDVILHGLLGQPTGATLFGMAMFIYSVVSLMYQEVGGFVVTFVTFVGTTAIPWITTILKYYNYRIFRVGDTVIVDSGLVRNYRSSFKINKINSVRVRRPLIARLMGKALLEAEVVGLSNSDKRPLLCPLKSLDVVTDLEQRLVPEFSFDAELLKQPSKAAAPSVLGKAFWSLVSMAIGAVIFLALENDADAADMQILYGILAVTCIAVPAVLLVQGVLLHRNREIATGDELFTFVYGGYDVIEETVRYDKVQIAEVSSGPIERLFGMSRCTVNLMSSMGEMTLKSGLFHADDLEKVPSEVIARIRDGRYDHRRYN